MSEEKKNSIAQMPEKKAPPKEWEWETPHGLVRLSLDLVRRYFCADATEPEVMHFLAVCKYHKINPWLKEAYLIKYSQSDPASIVIGKDFYNRRAQDFPTYGNHAAGIILQIKDASGKLSIERRPGAFHTSDEKILGGWAKVFRTDREEPIEIEVEISEYIQTKRDGTITRFWKEKPATMIRKVALAQAWREAFPKEFEGTLDEAEISGKEPMTIEMPKSNAQAESSAAAQSEKDVTKGPGAESQAEVPPADDTSLAQEAREREIAEASQQAQPLEGLRQRAWRLIQEKAAEKRLRPAQLLFQMTKKQAMAELSEVEVQGLLLQL